MPTRRAAPEPADLRQRFLDTAEALLESDGVGALSMREVARRAGVSHQAPYYYFADREAIIGAIAEQGFRMMSEFVQRSMLERPDAPHESIIAAGRAYLEFAFAHPAHFRVMFRPELVSPERHPNVQGEGLRACDTFLGIVQRAVEGGLPAQPNVDALFLTCWSFVHGLACLVLDGPLAVVAPDKDPKAQIRDALTAFAHMMEASVARAEPRAASKPAPARKPAKKKTSAKAHSKKASEPRR